MKRLKHIEIAKFLNVSHSAVSQWFCKRTKPTVDKAIKMRDEFDIPIEFWIEEKGIDKDLENQMEV